MAKTSKAFQPIQFDKLDSNLDDVFNELSAGGAGAGSSTTKPAEKQGGRTSNSRSRTKAPADSGSERGATGSKTPSPGKKKRIGGTSQSTAATAKQGGEEEEEKEQRPAPGSSLSQQDLEWFFEHSPDLHRQKQLYVDERTKDILLHVCRSAGVPASRVTVNIIRWFLGTHKDDIKKIISRNRNTLDKFEL